jgi:hypothetical protein
MEMQIKIEVIDKDFIGLKVFINWSTYCSYSINNDP